MDLSSMIAQEVQSEFNRPSTVTLMPKSIKQLVY